MASKRCLFDLDLCLVKQIRPNNSVIEDIGDINSTVVIHAGGHGPAEGQGADTQQSHLQRIDSQRPCKIVKKKRFAGQKSFVIAFVRQMEYFGEIQAR